MKRRNLILVGTGAAAGAAGLGWQAWRQSRAPGRASAHADNTAAGLWEMIFPTPDGGTLAMASLRGRPLLLNFWGTWCPPCVKEMPELDRFALEFAPKGWRVLGLAVDNLQPVQAYLARSPVSYAIGLAGFEGTELAKHLGNDPPGLPFTVALDRRGEVVRRKGGATTLEALRLWTENL